MAYRTPEGNARFWTYLPEAVVWELRRLAVAHRRRLAQEVQVAIEEYLARQGQEEGQTPRKGARG